MGIGLAVVKRILDDHGFAVDVDSEDGEGTTFRVRIPDRPSDSGHAERLAVAAELALSIAPGGLTSPPPRSLYRHRGMRRSVHASPRRARVTPRRVARESRPRRAARELRLSAQPRDCGRARLRA